MSVGPTGIPASAAGLPLAQSTGSETERAGQDASGQARRASAERQAEQAAGIGQTEQDEGASDRDADGRRPWEQAPGAPSADATDAESSPPKTPDPTGTRGTQIDLTG